MFGAESFGPSMAKLALTSDIHYLVEQLMGPSARQPLEEARLDDIHELLHEIEGMVQRIGRMRDPEVGPAWDFERQRVINHLRRAVQHVRRASASPLFK